MSPAKANTVRDPRTNSLLLVFGLLALVLSVPFMVRASYASSASVSMGYTDKLVGSQTVIYVTLSATDSQFPNQVVLSLVSYFNGASTAFNSQVVNSATSKGSVSETFTVPYEGVGNYLFVGSVKTAQGTLLLQCTIDPHIEPEWK